MSVSPIITYHELLEIYKNPEVLLFDVSNHKEALSNYKTAHLEGAFYVDVNTQLADIKSDLSQGGRHPLPSVAQFASTLTNLGITKNTHVIIYDDKNGANAAARFWWMLKAVGHEKVQVLNGGFTYAKENHFPLSDQEEVPVKAAQPYQIDRWVLPTTTIDEVEKVSQNPNYIVIDVRDKDRYDGKTEPLDAIAGHIPGAINIPFTENLDENGLFRTPTELRDKYIAVLNDTNPENRIVHCGSGVTACHTLLALDYAGITVPKLYVGSWSEWSRNNKEVVGL